MKKYIGFVVKEFYHIIRDFRTLLILFGIPVAQLLIFGYVISNEIKDAPLAVLDQSKDPVTREIVNKLSSSGYFIIHEYLDSEKQIEETFQKGIVREVVVFEPDFGRKLEREGTADVRLIADASDANSANIIVNYTSGVIYDYVNKLNRNLEIPFRIDVSTRMVFNEQLRSVYMFVPGTMALILMLISAMMTSISIVREKENGSMEVLLLSPLKPIQIILGKVSPYILLAFLDAVMIILVGIFVFGMPVKGSMALLLLESWLFILVALSLGIFISTFAKTQQVAMFVSLIGLLLPTLLLSGFIFPIENMPEI